MSLTWIIIIILILLVAIYIGIYNGLQKAKVHADEAWSQIDVQLKRRNDLIPNLVETVKGKRSFIKKPISKPSSF